MTKISWRRGMARLLRPMAVAGTLGFVALGAAQQTASLPTGKLAFGAFTGQFNADGTFTIAGQGWPTLSGTWKADGSRVDLVLSNPPTGCAEPATYTVSRSGTQVTFSMEYDSCTPRRMILDRSTWRPAGEAEAVPTRSITKESVR